MRTTHRPARALALMVGLCLTVAQVKTAEAQTDRRSARRLTIAIQKLVPYAPSGASAEGIRELTELQRALDPRVAATARFLRAAASVDLLTYATVTGDQQVRPQLARALAVDDDELEEHILESCDSVEGGVFAHQIVGYREVVSCLSDPATARCARSLRRVADGRLGGGATAARLLLVGPEVQAMAQARRAPVAGIAEPLVASAATTCAAQRDPELRRLCTADPRDQRAALRLAQAVVERAMGDLEAIERAGRGSDPLVALATPWIEQVRDSVGWMAFPSVLDRGLLANRALPETSSEERIAPLEVLIIDSTGVRVALTPVTALSLEGAARLDEAADLVVPGRLLLPAPLRFRAVIRPISEVEQGLRQIRARVDRMIEDQGDHGPQWLADEARPLGLVLEPSMMIADVARIIWSAQRAGYQRFAIFGRRPDGQVAVIVTDAGVVNEAPAPPGLPRITVGPREVRLAQGHLVTGQFERNDPRVGAAVATLLNGHSPIFAIEASQAWMSLGLIFSTLDSVLLSADPAVERCRLLLPH